MDDITEREKLLMNIITQEKKYLDAFYSFTVELNRIYTTLHTEANSSANVLNRLIYELKENYNEFFDENFTIPLENEDIDESS